MCNELKLWKFSDYKYVTKEQVNAIKTLKDSLELFKKSEILSLLLSLGD